MITDHPQASCFADQLTRRLCDVGLTALTVVPPLGDTATPEVDAFPLVEASARSATWIRTVAELVRPALQAGRLVVLVDDEASRRPSSLSTEAATALKAVEAQVWQAMNPAQTLCLVASGNAGPRHRSGRRMTIQVPLDFTDAVLAKILVGLGRAAGTSLHQPSLELIPAATTRRTVSRSFKSLAPARPTDVFDTYWHFAAERQTVFFARLHNSPAPWTADPILQQYRFTNAYRASDRVSQYLIRQVQYTGDAAPEELFFRTLLFKIFNKIDTWELLCRELGEIRWSSYRFDRYDAALTRAMERGATIFSAAYIMPSGGPHAEFSRKHRNYLKLLERMMVDDLPDQLQGAQNMRTAFELIRAYPMIGDFLAYQYVTDLNYSTLTNFDENEFVMPGPGARDGISKCFSDLGGLTEAELIRLVTERQVQEFDRLGLEFQTLWGRPLQLIDCQNLFCEVSKYTRASHPHVSGLSRRTRIKQTYKHNAGALLPWYPPKWGLNERILQATVDVS